MLEPAEHPFTKGKQIFESF